jgi:hypothetical protein
LISWLISILLICEFLAIHSKQHRTQFTTSVKRAA